jgi:hypothetical protein
MLNGSLIPIVITFIHTTLEAISRKIWNRLPKEFPWAGLHAPRDELGLNPTTT